jgi:hypothetical protein
MTEPAVLVLMNDHFEMEENHGYTIDQRRHPALGAVK